MLDIHSHLIYGIDDGAKTIEDSYKLIDQAVENKIDKVIATPHYNDYTSEQFFDLRDERCRELNDYTSNQNIPLSIEAGCEISFQINWDRFNQYDKCVIREKYLLLEFSDFEIPDNYLETIFQIRKKGFIPIIAHPERSIKLQKDVTIVSELHRLGCLFQLDAGSLKNHFGKDTLKTAQHYLEMNLYHLIGSDAHSPRGRNYNVYQDIDLSPFQNSYFNEHNTVAETTLVSVSKPSFLNRIKKRFL